MSLDPVLLKALAKDALVLTVNRRMARHLQKNYANEQVAAGKTAWATPQILAWKDWLAQVWQGLVDDRQVLDKVQGQVLWQAIVTESEVGTVLLNPDATAATAAKAYSLLRQWSMNLTALQGNDHLDVQALLLWAQTYEQRCESEAWLDEDTQVDLLIESIRYGEVLMPSAVVWAGFDAVTPQQRQLMRAQAEAGSEVGELAVQAQSCSAVLFPAQDRVAELRCAATWVAQKLAQSPDSRIAVVVPDLSSSKAQVERIFDEVLCPSASLQLSDSIQRPYNVSYGPPMADVPVIKAGLDFLALVGRPLDVIGLGRMIQSPFLGDADAELLARAGLDDYLRSQGEARYGLKALCQQCLNKHSPCPALANRLAQVMAYLTKLPPKQLPSAWGQALLSVLRLVGWPGQRTLDSAEYQAFEAWRGFVTGLSKLDLIVGEIRLAESINYLRQLSVDQTFQLKTPESRVQVLGLLEAAGLEFDHLWVMGLHDEVWPAPPSPNPLLPIMLQRDQQMPHASAERELAFAQETSRRLFSAAPDMVVSYPTKDGDRELRPSPLIDAMPLMAQAIIPPQGYRQQLHEVRALEYFCDWRASTLIAPDGEPQGVAVTGGASIFSDQAACPFRAFARQRLGARGLSEVTSGLTPAQRGSILHEVLELFWRDVAGHAQLVAMTDEQLNSRLAALIQAVLSRAAQRQPLVFTRIFSQLEAERLQRLCLDWLAQERARQPFTVVSSEEQRRVSLGGVQVDLKSDRIDRLDEDGREMILDYKTGRSSASDWFGDRPDAPQLPLYAVTHQRAVAALSFGLVRSDGCKFVGQSDGVDVIKGIGLFDDEDKDWDEQLAHWRQVLTHLAQEFCQGRADVAPKNPSTTCQYCDLASLCRVTEVNKALADDDEGLI